MIHASCPGLSFVRREYGGLQKTAPPPRSDPRSGEAVVLRREIGRTFRGLRQGASVKREMKFLIERREKVRRRFPKIGRAHV